ncbi:hypothetical protein P153DRAFT_435442 [Dothidotthia symphoricarpi CBS 119687]|uniref:T6SS Phospholipase effector Tle1-like catalytic domain-containing protein n=1 Tax=Dothidotthia symphoricarpi CBS 119687 TaxID=1392245 RepID=A0A6A5ZZ18_9PLEO|nr:uncharacterized protein P153DRAFT_435442 [Dothidotthia symphoricarpi CBS 119687]KAF2124265.1 hypothetical protein P153DRAFT_435442 [Dothidotthia symphoricarpi CBS 119687]
MSTVNSPNPDKKYRKLVLCFDGTGNTFEGNTSDTNVVKIYEKLKRDDDYQYHYYQPGIGTYDISGGSLNKNMLGNVVSGISKSIDSGLATSFDVHVMSGYRFLMNHYEPGAKIYMFGFSRGAFTARFLCRMINTVGLLSKGNDEMIPFAYSLYQQWEQARDDLEFHQKGSRAPNPDESSPLLNQEPKKAKELKEYYKMYNFTRTFCRRDKIDNPAPGEDAHPAVKIYFLGIFDCVSSVAVLETPFGRTPKPVSVVGTAEHVRHAVAVDEFRVKFKPALLAQDLTHEKYDSNEDIKEVWFPGNHGDVGGGWPAHGAEKEETGFLARAKLFLLGDKDKIAVKDVGFGPYQMSDIPLSWMLREVELIGAKEDAYALKWSKRLAGFKNNIDQAEAYKASLHNPTSFGWGSSFLKVLMWKFMEYIPLFPRYELTNEDPGVWKMQTWPANLASARDIPKTALLHASLLHRLHNDTAYKPNNNHGSGGPCLDKEKFVEVEFNEPPQDRKVDHKLYALDIKIAQNFATEADRIALVKEKERKARRAQNGLVTKPAMADRVDSLQGILH